MPGPDTNSKINVYNLGEMGVNLTKSPIHIEDGELVAGQNAEFYLDEGVGALRKRSGLRPLNPSTLGGTISGIVGVPLPGPGRRALYSGEVGNVDFIKSTDGGTTWVDISQLLGPTVIQDGSPLASVFPIPLAALTAGQFFYLGEAVPLADHVPVLLGHDGVAPYELVRLEANTWPRVLCVHAGVIYVGDSVAAATSRVWAIDPIAGTRTQLGTTFAGEFAASGVSYCGKVWVGTGGVGPAKLYSARPGATAWTLERTAAANQRTYVSLATFNGELYAGTAANAGTAAIVEKRDGVGAWTTDRTGASPANQNKFDGLASFQSELYAIYERSDQVYPGGLCQIQKRTAAGVWSIDKDLNAAATERIEGRLAVGQSLFYGSGLTIAPSGPPVAKLWRKIGTAGVWTAVVSTPHLGVMAVL